MMMFSTRYRCMVVGFVNTTGSGKAKESLDFDADPTIDPLMTPDDIVDGSGGLDASWPGCLWQETVMKML